MIIIFSVIIPLYNKEKSIRSTIESVLAQSYTHFELIIVNDGSTDGSLKIVENIKDERIRIINQNHGGVSKARNTGILASKNEYIVPLDADDIWESFALEEFVYLIKNFPKATVYATNMMTSMKSVKGNYNRYYVEDYYYSSAILLAKWNLNILGTGVVAIRRECFEKAGYYNEEITHGEDIELWIRLKDCCKIAKSEVVTMTYRLNAENRASNVAEHRQVQPNIKERNINDKISKSHKLYLGCLYFIKLTRGYKPSDCSFVQYYYPYKYWILKAMFLYAKYRIINKILNGIKNE